MKLFIKAKLKIFSMQKILFLSYVLQASVITIVMCILFYGYSSNFVMNQTDKYTITMLSELVQRIGGAVTNIANLSEFLSNNDELKYYIRLFAEADELKQVEIEKSISGIINNYWMSHPEVFNVNIFLASKEYTGSFRNAVYPLEMVRDTEWFSRLSGSDSIVQELYMLREDRLRGLIRGNQNTITALSRIKDNNNTAIGYLCIDMDTEYIYSKFLDNNKTSNNSSIYVVNNKGIIVAAEDISLVGTAMQTEHIEDIVSSSSSGNRRINNGDTLLLYTDTNSQGWKIIELIPMSVLYKDNNAAILWIVIIVALFSAFFLFPISYRLAKYITKPIFTLTSNIKVLQEQINSHFLYNTLDAISWNALEKNVPEISEMLSMLSNMYRLSLNRGQSIIKVLDEIEYIKKYMDLQKKCFANSFTYNIEIEPGLEELYMPKLTLQPLVENAIIHGFSKKESGGELSIRCYKKDGNLVIEVEDNGHGIPEEIFSEILHTSGKRRGYGIKNINERIKFISGSKYGLSFLKKDLNGTVATVTLPIVKEYEEI